MGMDNDTAALMVIIELRQRVAALEARTSQLTEENRALQAALDAAQPGQPAD